MVTEAYLAMTSEEFAAKTEYPAKTAWMACQFSSTGPDLSCLPASLPRNSLLILNDRTPIHGHDPVRITQQLRQVIDSFSCSALLLDFEESGNMELASLAASLTSALPCPVVVPDTYAGSLNCPVFLSPCPHHIPLADYLLPWVGRKIWLDLARDAEAITVTPAGSSFSPLPWTELSDTGHRDKRLCCHYRTECGDNFVRFTLWRTQEDLVALAQEGKALGVQEFVGLCQEWS